MKAHVERLNEAFSSFSAASGALEKYYEQLRETVRHLRVELEERNVQLGRALSDAETAREHLRCVLESMGEAIVVLDPEGAVTMINHAAGEMFGLMPETAAGRPYEGLGITINKEGADSVLIANGKRYDVIFSRSDMVDSSGFSRGTVLLIKDITRMKEIESHYERNRRLILMGEMAAKIVHEIRSPLCSIELYAEMLEDELAGQGPPELVTGIAMGIRSLNTILTNMIYFARNPKPRLAPMDLGDILDGSVSMLAPTIEAWGISLRREMNGGAVLPADAELLKQAFMNVLLNAIHAAGEGGTIGVALRRVGSDVVAAISDDGAGIPEEDRERIFDPFFSTKEKGTGLGLAIASKIMQAHEGFIAVRSGMGRGSTFEFHFPS